MINRGEIPQEAPNFLIRFELLCVLLTYSTRACVEVSVAGDCRPPAFTKERFAMIATIRCLMYASVVVTFVGLLSSDANGQTQLTPTRGGESTKWYSNGNGGSFAMRRVDIGGSVIQSTTRKESVRQVRLLYIGTGETVNSTAYGWTDAAKGSWDANVEKGTLTRYRVEVDIDVWVKIGSGWSYQGTQTRSTSTYNWTGTRKF
jgi:hypothetical protein